MAFKCAKEHDPIIYEVFSECPLCRSRKEIERLTKLIEYYDRKLQEKNA